MGKHYTHCPNSHQKEELICDDYHRMKQRAEKAEARVKELEAVLVSCYMSRHVSQIRDLHEKDGVSQCWHEGQKIVDKIKEQMR